MIEDVWEQAFVLMAGHGQTGACKIVASGMRKTRPENTERYRQWEALADCLNAMASASKTKH